ncbi:hypothetical protein PP577_05085 [Mycobacteroides abscessus]|nr:hypothetical protein [Mycobacteroides abscessus]MDM2426425.1 hypothetical protein [Mycobacteroides abscessus]MDM2429156.1 hypothetical protein [Mycobacteroides abscessus]MDM2433903.1 hypothetical protein [Mycobacteroides abscessus]MDM2442155.1 hypothetical protein [Mycobacteroides abscessus]
MMLDGGDVGSIAPVVEWINRADVEPIDSKVVPGASEPERRRLNALGGLVRALTTAETLKEWPHDLVSWVESGPSVPEKIAGAARAALERDPDAVLAGLYAQLVSVESRRPLGTFFTPAQEVQLMLDMWGAENQPASVVDVGAGVGVFTALASKKWPRAHVYAVDINPVTLGLLGMRMAGASPLVQPSGTKPGIRLIRDDFVSWISHHGEETPSPRLILGNPPYTRAQLLTKEDRVRLGELSDGLCGARASLSTLITAISLRHLGPKDGLCLLLPAQWLESNYAQPLRDYLARLQSRAVELRLVDSWRFSDAQVDAVALLVGPERADEQPFRVATWRSARPRIVQRRRLVGSQWRQLFDDRSPRYARANLTEFSLLKDFCTVRRGTATGANEFFVLNESTIIENRIPDTRLWRLARKLNVYGDRLDDAAFDRLPGSEKRWLLNVSPRYRTDGSAVDLYIAHGEAAKLHERYLCADRKIWYDLSNDMVIPDVIIGPMTRNIVRIVENKAGCAIVNNLYGWRWKENVSMSTRKKILNWLRSEPGQNTLLKAARQQGDGLMKLEPSALSTLQIPADVATPCRTSN